MFSDAECPRYDGRSSLGLIGLGMMLVDDVGDLTIAKDGAAILQKLDVHHPASKALIQPSALHDKEVDYETTVILLETELLRLAHDLIEKKVHQNTEIFRLSQRCPVIRRVP